MDEGDTFCNGLLWNMSEFKTPETIFFSVIIIILQNFYRRIEKYTSPLCQKLTQNLGTSRRIFTEAKLVSKNVQTAGTQAGSRVLKASFKLA